MRERALATLLSLIKCENCGKGFRTEYYEDRPWVINYGDTREHAQHVYSLNHYDCKEEA